MEWSRRMEPLLVLRIIKPLVVQPSAHTRSLERSKEVRVVLTHRRSQMTARGSISPKPFQDMSREIMCLLSIIPACA